MYPKTNKGITNNANETKDVSNKENLQPGSDGIINNDQLPKTNDQITNNDFKPAESNFITDYYASLFIEPS